MPFAGLKSNEKVNRIMEDKMTVDMDKPFAQFAEDHLKTHTGNNSELSAGLAAIPIVKQTHKIMVGRLKSGNIFMQADCVKMEIEPGMVNDLIAALLMAKGG